jgi:hypothetical protein
MNLPTHLYFNTYYLLSCVGNFSPRSPWDWRLAEDRMWEFSSLCVCSLQIRVLPGGYIIKVCDSKVIPGG